jgi:hypothetical protein
MIYASWKAYTKGYMNYSPNEFSENTLNKEMLYYLIMIAETTFFISMPIYLN